MCSAAAKYVIRSIAGAVSLLAGLSVAAGRSMANENISPSIDDAPRACPAFPEIPFEQRPAYLSPDTLALTFDDGPDLVNTPRVLDVLAREGVQATFFINAENWSSLGTSERARAIVRRMVEEGHSLGNHTVHHLWLSTLTPERIEQEIVGVELVVRDILGSEAPRLTLFRAPYGDAYLGSRQGPRYRKVAPIVARHAIHIGWSIAPSTGACHRSAGLCVLAFTKNQLDEGAYGIILLHSTHAETAAGLPLIIAEARRRGMRFVSVEDVVRARFQRSSAELVDDPHCRDGE
jgi:peptidoglycan/xylan/chitin deacetylase (PgdA/CDA1 family)